MSRITWREMDSLTNTVSEFQISEDGKLDLRHVQDVTESLELTKAIANSCDGYSKNRRMKWIAAIPVVVHDQLRRDGVLQDKKRFRAWLNDPDNKLFRIAGGRV